MRKKRRSNNNNTKEKKNILPSTNTIDGEMMTQAIIEAYRIIEKEKKLKAQEEVDTQKNKEKWYIKALFILNVILCPWKINKKFTIKNSVYDSILVVFVTLILGFFGAIIWLAGLGTLVYSVVLLKNISGFIGMLATGIMVMTLGSMFILSANEFSKVSDSNIIYAYSASVIALIGCIVAVISLIKELL